MEITVTAVSHSLFYVFQFRYFQLVVLCITKYADGWQISDGLHTNTYDIFSTDTLIKSVAHL